MILSVAFPPVPAPRGNFSRMARLQFAPIRPLRRPVQKVDLPTIALYVAWLVGCMAFGVAFARAC